MYLLFYRDCWIACNSMLWFSWGTGARQQKWWVSSLSKHSCKNETIFANVYAKSKFFGRNVALCLNSVLWLQGSTQHISAGAMIKPWNQGKRIKMLSHQFLIKNKNSREHNFAEWVLLLQMMKYPWWKRCNRLLRIWLTTTHRVGFNNSWKVWVKAFVIQNPTAQKCWILNWFDVVWIFCGSSEIETSRNTKRGMQSSWFSWEGKHSHRYVTEEDYTQNSTAQYCLAFPFWKMVLWNRQWNSWDGGDARAWWGHAWGKHIQQDPWENSGYVREISAKIKK